MTEVATKKTLVIGASNKGNRYSFVAANRLASYSHPIVLIGSHTGTVAGEAIQQGYPHLDDIHTVTMYINPTRQPEYYDYVLQLKPKRVIFNPGTENPAFAQLLKNNGIEVLEACTLVMLATRQY